MSKAITVTIRTSDGSTHTRAYAVDPKNVEIQSYAEWAVGNIIALVCSGYTDTLDFPRGEHNAVEIIHNDFDCKVESIVVDYDEDYSDD